MKILTTISIVLCSTLPSAHAELYSTSESMPAEVYPLFDDTDPIKAKTGLPPNKLPNEITVSPKVLAKKPALHLGERALKRFEDQQDLIQVDTGTVDPTQLLKENKQEEDQFFGDSSGCGLDEKEDEIEEQEMQEQEMENQKGSKQKKPAHCETKLEKARRLAEAAEEELNEAMEVARQRRLLQNLPETHAPGWDPQVFAFDSE